MNEYGRNYPQQQQEPMYAEPAYMTPPMPEKPKGNKLLTVFVIITFVLCAANTALIGLLFFESQKTQTAEEQLAETKAANTYEQKVADECIDFDDFEITETSPDAIYFECEIRNTSNRVLDDITVYYDIYDKNDRFIGSTYTFIPHIYANSSIVIEEVGYFKNAKKVKITETFATYADDIR